MTGSLRFLDAESAAEYHESWAFSTLDDRPAAERMRRANQYRRVDGLEGGEP